jgi:peptide-methionine (R)-S-oxide reductase
MRTLSWLAVALILLTAGCPLANNNNNVHAKEQAAAPPAEPNTPEETPLMTCDSIPFTDDEWREKLTPEQYEVMRKKGTERAFTGALLNNKQKGAYTCAGCKSVLFNSDAKFESGTGWPSYYQPAAEDSVRTVVDRSHGMVRTEVVCGKCGGHLGHVFDDGPRPTGLRYCINSASLDFVPAKE